MRDELDAAEIDETGVTGEVDEVDEADENDEVGENDEIAEIDEDARIAKTATTAKTAKTARTAEASTVVTDAAAGVSDAPAAPDDADEATDRELLAAWGRGDRAAGGVLFGRHYPSVARFFHNKTNEAIHEDLVHETFLACQKSAARFRGDAKFKTFLLGIARNVLADHVRRVIGKSRRDSEAEIFKLPAVYLGPSPIVSAVRNEEQRLLLKALRNIPLNHQITLELHYWEGLTTTEIGEVLEVPLGTVRTRLRDGRAHLVEQFAQIASSREALLSTLDDLQQWAERMRRQVNARRAAGPRQGKPRG